MVLPAEVAPQTHELLYRGAVEADCLENSDQALPPGPEAANGHARTRRRVDNVARNAKGGLVQGVGGGH